MNNKNFLQETMMNNFYNKTNNNLNNEIWNTIQKADEMLIHSLNNKLFDTYHAKINLLFSLLYSDKPLPLNDKNSIIKFFNIISPLNNEFNLGSYNWNYKLVDGKLFVQNSILKSDFNKEINLKYFNPIKNILNLSNINFEYYEFKSNRFFKNIDIIYVFNL